MINHSNYDRIKEELKEAGAALVAVSKIKPVEDIRALYEAGQRDFGENYVQELMEKQALLPVDLRWHFIGHLQSNKVKFIAPFVNLIHGIDSVKLLREVNKQGGRIARRIDVLLQVHIAREETKFGMNEAELVEALESSKELEFVRMRGLMGMASFSDDEDQVRSEFRLLAGYYNSFRERFGLDVLSMGMSGDYRLAVREGSTMVRIGSLIFGARG